MLIELHHPTAQARVIPCTIEGRFAVSPSRTSTGADAGATPVAAASWLDGFEDMERKVFAHLEAHGVVTESEAVMLLGSQRALRRFSLRFEELARDAPFEVGIEVVAGVKRYVREGGKP
nr:hypothetical protein [Thiocapsa sp. KS1]